MAFKLSRNSMAGRAPDLVDDIAAGAAFAADPSTIVPGKAVTITAGVLVQSVTTDAIAGYLAVKSPDVDYGGGINPIFPDGVVSGETGLLFQPVSGINSVFADIGTAEASAGDILVGEALDLDAGGLTLNGTTSATGVDFRVTKIVERDSGGKAIKVEGFFLSTGYFA